MTTLKEFPRTATCREYFPRYGKNYEGLSTSHRGQRQNGATVTSTLIVEWSAWTVSQTQNLTQIHKRGKETLVYL